MKLLDFLIIILPGFFSFSDVSALGFVHLRPSYWVKDLVICSLSVEDSQFLGRTGQ
jgi:hypothetical protein